MTLDIERERLDFEAQPGIKESYDLTGFFADGEWAYNDRGTNFAFFDGWLAAKRAAVGSAEPVAWLVYAGIFEKKPIYPAHGHKHLAELQASELKTETEIRPLFTAPPAPVSAEPDQNFWDWLPLAYGDAGKGGQPCFTKFNMEVAFHAGKKSAMPSADAKDSERIPTRAELLHKLYHHQGGSSPIGQPIRALLGIGQHDKLTKAQLAEIKAYAAIAAKGQP